MGADSKIEWTHHTLRGVLPSSAQIGFCRDRLQVQSFVTITTKGDAVLNNKTKFGKVSVGLDVVCLEVSASVIAAVLASIAITGVYSITPMLVLSRAPIFAVSLMLTVAVSIVLLAARCAFASNLANLAPRFFSVAHASAVARAPLSRLAHLLTRLCRMLHAFKWRSTPFGGFALRNPDAQLTLCVQSVAAVAINIEIGTLLPRFTAVTPLQANVKFGGVLLNT